MNRCTTSMLAGVATAVSPALAADLPLRKPGLWEFKIGRESLIDFTFQQCIDAATDQIMMSSSGPLPQEVCSGRDVQRSGDTITIDSICKLKDKTATSHAVITGSMDSAYTMTVTAESEAMPGGRMDITTAGRWIGPCAADQKPGDMTMGTGSNFTAVAVGLGVMPMLADDLPVRKVGLWEVRRVTEESGRPPPCGAGVHRRGDRPLGAVDHGSGPLDPARLPTPQRTESGRHDHDRRHVQGAAIPPGERRYHALRERPLSGLGRL